jgi:hypothetical protein
LPLAIRLCYSRRTTRLLPTATLIIGATSVNSRCPLTHTNCHTAIVHKLENINRRPPSWRTTGSALAATGGQYLTVNASVTQTRDDGRNLKRHLIDDYRSIKDLRILNCPWGLELSRCTYMASKRTSRSQGPSRHKWRLDHG